MREILKTVPDATNEVHDLDGFRDPGSCSVTPVVQLEPTVALAIVTALSQVVRRAHASPAATSADPAGILRAQAFEEGDVYMLAPPYEGFGADRYLMDFYDVSERNICSRMHLHTGCRFVRLMTGPETQIRVSSLSRLEVTQVEGVSSFSLDQFVDELPGSPGGSAIRRYNVIVPENAWVDMQVPRGVSHQFNATGPNAVVDSVHPEESMETLRERISGYGMMAQTIFLTEDRPPAETCDLRPAHEPVIEGQDVTTTA